MWNRTDIRGIVQQRLEPGKVSPRPGTQKRASGGKIDWMRLRAAFVIVLLLAAACGGSGGTACAVCMQEKCADLIGTCDSDPGCACMIECVGQNGIPGVDACLGTCGLAERPANFAQVEECTAVACPDEGDECATPAGWMPPGDGVTCDMTGTGTIGGGALADCSFDTGLVFDPEGTVLQLQSADMTVCARIDRRNDGPGALANTQWTLIELRAGPLGEVALVDGQAACWYSSHHNFRDWVHAWTGTRHYEIVLKEDGHGGARTYQLYVYEQGPVDPMTCPATADGMLCIDGPIDLLPVNP